MKRIPIVSLIVILLTGCNGWSFQPSGTNAPTPFRVPSQTPAIVTVTPAGAVSPTPLVATSPPVVETPAVFVSDTPQVLPTDTASPEPSLGVEILGCNTSIDITHGLGEVTNAFVTLKNTGNTELMNLRVTLYALDEGQEHPDKTVELTSLPVSYQVNVKLTVDSTYHADTPIQVEVFADGGLFQRLGQNSCADIGVFAPDPGSLNTPVPVIP
jgi:hypothetical protein